MRGLVVAVTCLILMGCGKAESEKKEPSNDKAGTTEEKLGGQDEIKKLMDRPEVKPLVEEYVRLNKMLDGERVSGKPFSTPEEVKAYNESVRKYNEYMSQRKAVRLKLIDLVGEKRAQDICKRLD